MAWRCSGTGVREQCCRGACLRSRLNIITLTVSRKTVWREKCVYISINPITPRPCWILEFSGTAAVTGAAHRWFIRRLSFVCGFYSNRSFTRICTPPHKQMKKSLISEVFKVPGRKESPVPALWTVRGCSMWFLGGKNVEKSVKLQVPHELWIKSGTKTCSDHILVYFYLFIFVYQAWFLFISLCPCISCTSLRQISWIHIFTVANFIYRFLNIICPYCIAIKCKDSLIKQNTGLLYAGC